jgi:hypothetical protein
MEQWGGVLTEKAMRAIDEFLDSSDPAVVAKGVELYSKFRDNFMPSLPKTNLTGKLTPGVDQEGLRIMEELLGRKLEVKTVTHEVEDAEYVTDVDEADAPAPRIGPGRARLQPPGRVPDASGLQPVVRNTYGGSMQDAGPGQVSEPKAARRPRKDPPRHPGAGSVQEVRGGGVADGVPGAGDGDEAEAEGLPT